MSVELNDVTGEKGETYTPNNDVIALCGLRAPNKGVHHEESDYVNHGLKILDSFVSKTNAVIKNISLI
jgi:hypothetical protein